MARRNCRLSIRGRSAIVEHQLVICPLPIVLQDHGGIVGFPGFLGPAALEPHPPILQQRGGSGFCEGLLLCGEEFAVFPEDKAALPVFAEESLFALGDSAAAAGAGADSLPVRGEQDLPARKRQLRPILNGASR